VTKAEIQAGERKKGGRGKNNGEGERKNGYKGRNNSERGRKKGREAKIQLM